MLKNIGEAYVILSNLMGDLYNLLFILLLRRNTPFLCPHPHISHLPNMHNFFFFNFSYIFTLLPISSAFSFLPNMPLIRLLTKSKKFPGTLTINNVKLFNNMRLLDTLNAVNAVWQLGSACLNGILFQH